MSHSAPLKEGSIRFHPLGISLICDDCGYETTMYHHQRFGYARVDLELHVSENLPRNR